MVYKTLSENGLSITAFFYNPNIQPEEECLKRKQTMERYADIVELKVVYQPNDVILKPRDCEECYRVRLSKTAQSAAAHGFEAFSTTLLISPYQKHGLLKKIGEDSGTKYGVKFHYQDFRPLFSESQKMAREHGLYRQKYCGCMG
jgi:predicted adenine nucleotide alpha hydrolase (AANH) superfamily ATPase